MHQLIRTLVEHNEAGEKGEAEAIYAQVENHPDKIVAMLQAIEHEAASRER